MRAGAGEVLVYSFHSVNLFNWFHFEPDVRVSMKSPHSSGWLWGELQCEHKRAPFCDNFSLMLSISSVHRRAQSLACMIILRGVFIACVLCMKLLGWGLIWARRLRARASHSYRGVWQTHVGGPLWKLDMRRRHCGCAKYSEIQNRQKWNYCSFATC